MRNVIRDVKEAGGLCSTQTN